MSEVIKHSITIAGHSTSISLENEFWVELNKIAVARDLSLAALVREIDQARGTDTKEAGNLSSSLRVYVLNHLRQQVSDLLPTQQTV